MSKAPRVYNVNVGVLGHVDSGKTSLVAALSTKLSTAALDKHPQSKQRGITLDLGFSSLSLPMPDGLQQLPYDELQFTLVDCPGHASLIRTIMGGAQIIDMMILVVDVTKGVQTQTAECLVVGEIATQDIVVVLNKIDLLPAEQRSRLVAKASRRLRQTFSATKFRDCIVVAVAAKPGGGGELTRQAAASAEGVRAVVDELVRRVPTQPRDGTGPFLFAIDHCFAIKGQGTVLTGTALSGALRVGDAVELPELKVTKKVKSMQMFKQPVQQCCKGDRAGICVTQLDPQLVERGLACSPGSVPTFQGAIIAVEKIRFFQGTLPSRSRFHITAGHATVMGEAHWFGLPDGSGVPAAAALQLLLRRIDQLSVKGSSTAFNLKQDYVHQEELHGLEGRPVNPLAAALHGNRQHQLQLPEVHYGPQWGLIKFAQPVTAPQDALIIGSRFDTNADGSTCRLAFYGRILQLLDPADAQQLQQLRIYKLKQKQGVVERMANDGCTAVCRGMFKRETDISLFAGMKVLTLTGVPGKIEGPFGKSGKFKVALEQSLDAASAAGTGITLTFKKMLHDPNRRRMLQ